MCSSKMFSAQAPTCTTHEKSADLCRGPNGRMQVFDTPCRTKTTHRTGYVTIRREIRRVCIIAFYNIVRITHFVIVYDVHAGYRFRFVHAFFIFYFFLIFFLTFRADSAPVYERATGVESVISDPKVFDRSRVTRVTRLPVRNVFGFCRRGVPESRATRTNVARFYFNNILRQRITRIELQDYCRSM